MTDESEQLEPQEDHVTDPPTSVSDSDTARDPFEEIASEFSERYRDGEMPSVEEYAQRYPEMAEEIRDLFPTIAAMEQLKEKKAPAKPAVGGLELEQLGDFRILGEIGRGGMGVVYEAEQVSLGRHVAVKVLPKQALLDERHLRRFEREAQTAAKLHHTNIVPVFGVGQQDGFHYIVMQFIPGVGLDEILVSLRTLVLDEDASQYRIDSSRRASHANHNAKALLDGNFSKHASMNLASSFTKDTPTKTIRAASKTMPVADAAATVELPTDSNANSNPSSYSVDESAVGSLSGAGSRPPKALSEDNSRVLASLDKEYYRSVARIGQQVADALAYAHEQGTLHRDIKPGNLLLDGAGTVWVADFGLAKLAEQDAVSRTGDLVGTLSYMPPESFSGETDARGDIYALGLTLYEMLAMRPAYYGRDRAKLVKQITDGDLPRLSKLNPAVPRDLETIVLKSIAHRPEDRYATARKFEEDLECYLNDMPITARRMSVPEQFTRWCRKNKLVASLSAAVLTLLMLSSITFGFLYRKASKAIDLAEDRLVQVEQEKQTAQKESDRATAAEKAAKQTALETLDALTAIFPKERLPPTADQSLAGDESADVTSDQDPESETELNEEASATVATAEITPDRAALIEKLLPFVERLAKRADTDQDFAARFANLTIRAGKLHRMLSNHEEALKYFDDGIEKYSAIVKRADPLPASVIGLASSYNEKGDLLKLTGSREAFACFTEARKLFQDHNELLQNSPRAKYEEARTYFLASMQYRRGGRWRFGRGGRGGRGNDPNRRPRDGGGRSGGGHDGDRQRGPRGGGGPNDGPPRPDGERRGEGPSRRGPEFGERLSDVRRAIDLLEPLVETETNPEYRYLLARCYTSIASGRGPRDQQRQASISKAVALLSKLVEDQPSVSDYKYEFVIASLELAQPNFEERLRSTEKIVEITKEISKQNPAISTYGSVHGRALREHALALTHVADQTSDQKQQLKLRVKAKTTMDLAEANWRDVQERFPDAREELANPMRPAPMLKELKFEVEGKLSLAQANQFVETNRADEAKALLVPLRERCLEELKRRARVQSSGFGTSRDGNRNSITELVAMLCKTEQYLESEEAALAMLDRVVEERRKAVEDRLKAMGYRISVSNEIASLMKARVLKSLGKHDDAIALLQSLRERLGSELEKFEGRKWLESVLFREVLTELNDHDGLRAFDNKKAQERGSFVRPSRSVRPPSRPDDNRER